MKEQEIKPFNGHTPLPYALGHRHVYALNNEGVNRMIIQVLEGWTDHHESRTGDLECHEVAAFVHEATAAYYPSRLLIEKLVKALEENNDSLRVAITSEDPHVGESLGMQLDENNEVLAEASAFLKP